MSHTKIIIKDLHLDMFIGIYGREKKNRQKVKVNVELSVHDLPDTNSDNLKDVLNYEVIVSGIQSIADKGHINLIETFAERIVYFCLEQEQVLKAKVKVEKPDAFDAVDSVAVQVERKKS